MKQSKKPRQFGGIRKLPSGKFQASYTVNGKREPAPSTFARERDAKAWLATIEADHIRGIVTGKRPRNVPTLNEYAETYIADRFPKLKKSTEDQYRMIVRKYFDGPGALGIGKLKLYDLDVATVRAWYAELGRTLQMSRRVIGNGSDGSTMRAHAFNFLRSLLNVAVEDEYFEFNPCNVKSLKKAGIARKQRPEEEILTHTEIDNLADAIVPHYRALVYVAAYGGLRISELLGLRRADVNFLHGTVTIRESKTPAGKRTVVLPRDVMDALETHFNRYVRDNVSAPVFVTRTGTVPDRSVVGSALRTAGRKVGRPDVFLHLLRHTALTLAEQTGATQTELLARAGHTTVRVSSIYRHASEQGQRAIAESLGRARQADAA